MRQGAYRGHFWTAPHGSARGGVVPTWGGFINQILDLLVVEGGTQGRGRQGAGAEQDRASRDGAGTVRARTKRGGDSRERTGTRQPERKEVRRDKETKRLTDKAINVARRKGIENSGTSEGCQQRTERAMRTDKQEKTERRRESYCGGT